MEDGPSPRGGEAFSPRSFARGVAEYCRRLELFEGRRHTLVMVSGGQDSVALLHLLATGALGPAGSPSLLALHVNHGLRGDASAADQALVEELCGALGVRLTVRRAPVDKERGNVQAAAREARRSAAAEVAAEVGAECVALGHTLDDQVETLLYRLGRYGGVRALAAMRPSEGEWVRPLLARRRWETAAYCEAAGLVFARDLGNEDPRYVRTAIRREVVPAWERSLPGAVEAAGRAAEAARDAVDVMSALIDVVAGAVCPGSAVVSASRLEEVAPPLRRAFLHDWLGRAGVASVTRSGVDAVDTLAARAGSGEVALGEGWRVRKDYDRLLVMEPGANQGVPARIRAPGDGGAPSGPVVLPLPGAVKWGGLRLRGEPVDRYRAHDPRAEAFLDARVVTGPLVVRAVAEGDRIRPLGAPGSRSLQDVLVDARVPRRLRRRIPVVTCGDVILWVGGLVVAEECRIRVDTERIVRLAIERTGATPGQ